ncbi:MAG: ethanolamine utilization protein EutN [Candidatus Neomarinimicrobiota bacterium]|nr:MAG: ethanolamine utilization protein EutN [Candidatus Neomarinimicrobiota bacterium]
MKLGRVIGTVTPAVVYAGLEGAPLLLIQGLDKRCRSAGSPFVATDPTRMAGPGELIYYESSREAALAMDPWFVPVDAAVIGIVDDLRLLEDET